MKGARTIKLNVPGREEHVTINLNRFYKSAKGQRVKGEKSRAPKREPANLNGGYIELVKQDDEPVLTQ